MQMNLAAFKRHGQVLTGRGENKVGEYTISGTIQGKQVEFKQVYAGKHVMSYKGTLSKKGKLEGTYTQPAKHGGEQGQFELQVGGALDSPPSSPTKSISPKPSAMSPSVPESPVRNQPRIPREEYEQHEQHAPFVLQEGFWDSEGGVDGAPLLNRNAALFSGDRKQCEAVLAQTRLWPELCGADEVLQLPSVKPVPGAGTSESILWRDAERTFKTGANGVFEHTHSHHCTAP